MRVLIKDFAGRCAMAVEPGLQIHDLVAPAIERGEPVELDFEGVVEVGPPFLNPAYGWLIQEYSPERVAQLVRIVNQSPRLQNMLDAVVAVNTRCWKFPAYREALYKVVMARSNEDR